MLDPIKMQNTEKIKKVREEPWFIENTMMIELYLFKFFVVNPNRAWNHIMIIAKKLDNLNFSN